MDYDRLTDKQRLLDSLRPLPEALTRNLDAWFRIELTYSSNAIEGNTLTRRETAVVIEQGLAVAGKSLKDHIETANHAAALDFVRARAARRPARPAADDILSIHGLILRGIDDAQAGRYRSVPVRIAGTSVIMPNPRKVPDLMDALHDWLAGAQGLHPVAFAGEAHYRLVTIHPFVDGNGRTARLLMNLLLLLQGYPPAIIRTGDRLAYIGALEKAQLGGAKTDYERLIAQAVNRSLDIYLKAARGEAAAGDDDAEGLLRIGALAKAAGVTVPTIRHWTQAGLLEVAAITESGYHCYAAAMVGRCAQILALQAERLTLREIRARLRAV